MSFKISDCVKIDLSGRPKSFRALAQKDWQRISGQTAPFALDLSCTTITDKDICFLLELEQMKLLRLSWTKISDNGLKTLSGLKNLEMLFLDYTDISGEGLADFSNLSVLSFYGCKSLSMAGFQTIGNLTQLRKLEMTDSNITDAGMALLEPLVNLEWLSLGHCIGITNDGLAHLEPLAKLRTLSLHCNDSITDDGLAHLAGLVEIRRLFLDSCNNITDDGLYHLSKMRYIAELSLKDCKMVGVHDVTGLAMLLMLRQMGKSGYQIPKKADKKKSNDDSD